MGFGVFGNGHNHQSITDQNKKQMTAMIKMFFIMGITWLAEIVSFSVEWHDPTNSDNPISFACNIINALQVCKPMIFHEKLYVYQKNEHYNCKV